ncbi:MAG: hypothetical protein ACLP7P_16545 [Rhodomicrobium sp.]
MTPAVDGAKKGLTTRGPLQKRRGMVKLGMVNGGGFLFLPAAKLAIFRDFTPKMDVKKSVKYIFSPGLTLRGRKLLAQARRLRRLSADISGRYSV